MTIRLLIGACFWLSVLHAQEPWRQFPQLPSQDSPLMRCQALIDTAWAYYGRDALLADACAQEAYRIALVQGNWKKEARALNVLGIVWLHADQLATSQCYYDQALEIYRSAADSTGMLSCLNNSSRLYEVKGDCEQAISATLEALRICQRLPSPSAGQNEVVISISYLGALNNCEQYAQVLSYADTALDLANRQQLGSLSAHLLHALGFAQKSLDKYSEALHTLHMAQDSARTYEDVGLEAGILNSLAGVYLGMGQINRGIETFQRSLEMTKRHGIYDPTDFVTYSDLGEALLQAKRYREATSYLLQAIDHATESQKHFPLPRTYLALGHALAGQGDSAAAYLALAKAVQWQDFLVGKEVQIELQRLNQTFESERLATSLELTQLRMEQQQTRYTAVIAMILGGSLTVFVIYLLIVFQLQRRRLEAEKRQVELKYTALRAQMNPHFIFNALNSIQGFFAEQDFANGNEYLGAFGDLMRSVLEYSRQSTITLREELDTLELYLQLEQVRLRDRFTYTFDLPADLDDSMVRIPPLIFQPFVENAIWHGLAPKDGPGHIRISISYQGKHLLAVIEDDGIGLRAARQRNLNHHRSQGVSITAERLGDDGELLIEELKDRTGNSCGTRVTMSIPQDS